MEKSLNNLELEKLNDIINYIKSSKQYKDYIYLHNKLANNKEAISYINEIKKLQKKIVQNQSQNNDITILEEEINILLTKLNTIPLYVDYINKQTELNEFYNYLKNTLDNYFTDLVN